MALRRLERPRSDQVRDSVAYRSGLLLWLARISEVVWHGWLAD